MSNPASSEPTASRDSRATDAAAAASPASSPSPVSDSALPFRAAFLATLGIAFVVMLVALDQSIVATALPSIVAELHGFRLYAWIATSYLLTSVVTVPIFGRLGDDFGRKPFVLASIVIFTGASLLCGVSRSMTMLIIARALQGVGGGMLVGTAFACVPDLFPSPLVRMRWQVILSSAYGIANAVGPSLGGLLTETLGWRSVFFVNLPIGVISAWFVWRYLPRLRQGMHGGTHKGRVKIDWLGAVLLAGALVAIQLGVGRLQNDGIGLPGLGLLALAAVAGVALWQCERRATHPILPLTMFADVRLSSLFMLSLLAGGALFSLLFYAPLLFQGGFGLSPGNAGALVTPLVVCITVGSITNSRIITRLRKPNRMLTLGFGLLTVGCIGVMLAQRTTPVWWLSTCMASTGLGLGWILPNLTVFGQEQAGRERLGTVTAMLQSLRMIGGMTGTALTGAVISHVYQARIRTLLDSAQLSSWFGAMANPQILVDQQDETRLVAQLVRAGHNGQVIDLARSALVTAVHLGLGCAVLAAAWGLWQTRRVPSIQFSKEKKATPSSPGDKK
ncbi:MFS transporter [Robbsia sp. KACC 23696]|uniref:MFS transporter n=1 Tax=Robbsia sp. KACC 23696 TaxID=3149231 RepID=UPI00325BEF43